MEGRIGMMLIPCGMELIGGVYSILQKAGEYHIFYR